MEEKQFNYEELEGLAEKHYKDLPYHNFLHALDVMKKCKEFIEKSKKYGIKVDEKIILVAALFHDAGYSCKIDGKSKEEHSVDIAKEELFKAGFSEEFLKKVSKVILSTSPNEIPKTAEEKILRASDLSNFAGDFSTFLRNNKLLKKEYEELNNISLTEEQWKNMTKNTTFHYLSQDIRLTPEHDNEKGESVFHINALKNIYEYLK